MGDGMTAALWRRWGAFKGSLLGGFVVVGVAVCCGGGVVVGFVGVVGIRGRRFVGQAAIGGFFRVGFVGIFGAWVFWGGFFCGGLGCGLGGGLVGRLFLCHLLGVLLPREGLCAVGG
jgi:hypothetical protein